jgi:hypothetical protein
MKSDFDPVEYFKKFPQINREDLEKCLKFIPLEEFSTSDFERIFRQECPDSHRAFVKVAPNNWKPGIGRRLSELSNRGILISRCKKSSSGGKIWRKK